MALNASKRPLVRLLSITLRAHPWSTLVTLLVSGLSAVTPSVVVGLTGAAVAAVAEAIAHPSQQSEQAATTLGVLLVAASAISPLLGQVGGYLLGRVQVILARRLQLELSEKCDELSLEQLESPEVRNVQELATRTLRTGIAPSLADALAFAGGLVSFLTLSGLLLSWDIDTALLVILAPVPALLGNVLFSRIGWRVQVARVDRLRFTEYAMGMLSDRRWVPEVRLLGATAPLRTSVRRHTSDFTREDLTVLRNRWLANLFLVVIATLLTAGAYFLAIMKALSVGDVGLFAGFMVGAATIQGVIQQLVGSGATLVGHSLRLQAFYSFLDTPGKREKGFGLTVEGPPSIELDHVSFTYPQAETPALKDLTFRVAPGETVALVGPNGGGKSTVFKLLLGSYAPTSGRLLVDGREVRGEARLSTACAAVFQEQVRFVGSVRDNVTGCLPPGDVDEDRVVQVLNDVGLAARVASLPEGLDTRVGREFGGQDFSVGEWQRLALARALYRDAPLLLLDEPTSAADKEASLALRRILERLGPSKTVLMITHDSEALSMTDRCIQLA